MRLACSELPYQAQGWGGAPALGAELDHGSAPGLVPAPDQRAQSHQVGKGRCHRSLEALALVEKAVQAEGGPRDWSLGWKVPGGWLGWHLDGTGGFGLKDVESISPALKKGQGTMKHHGPGGLGVWSFSNKCSEL